MELYRHYKVPDFDEEEEWLSQYPRESSASFRACSW
jgi:hypothetical protein